MVSYRRVCILLVAASVTGAPLALAAGWGVKGQWEPSTPRDRVDGYMFLTPDQDPASDGRKVYFNGWMGQYAYYSTHLNPNAQAAAGTSIVSYPAEAWALLGTWKDCNKDGFVGWGDQGLWEYKAEMLTLPGQPGFTVCPKDGDVPSSYPSALPAGWTPPHNDGKWIHEYVAIGWRYWPDSVELNPWAFNDSNARVWADYGRPGDALVVQCSLSPAPRGTFQSTGGVIAWTDCPTGYQATRELNAQAEQNEALKPFSFADKPMGQQGSSGSDLNARNPWGTESDAALVQAWDCDAPTRPVTKDPTWDGRAGPTHVPIPNPAPAGDRTIWVNASDRDGWLGVGVSSVAGVYARYNASNPRVVPGVDPAGSPAGAVNATEAGFDQCHRDASPGPGVQPNAPYALEGDVDVDTGKRVTTDFALHYEAGRSRAGPLTLTGWGAPPDAGVKATGRESCFSTGVLYSFWCYDGLWADRRYSDVDLVAGAKNPYVARESLSPAPVTWITYYAFVSPEAQQRYGFDLPGLAGKYGAEGCLATPQTVECDPGRWWPQGNRPKTSWLSGNGGDAADDVPYGVVAGQDFNLRDVDCYDQSLDALRTQGLTWGSVSGTSCA